MPEARPDLVGVVEIYVEPRGIVCELAVHGDRQAYVIERAIARLEACATGRRGMGPAERPIHPNEPLDFEYFDLDEKWYVLRVKITENGGGIGGGHLLAPPELLAPKRDLVNAGLQYLRRRSTSA